jgi:two-component system OmpR family response regulator
VNGFKIGADDYITKPFDTELLLYKIQAVLKRSTVDESESITQFELGSFSFDAKLRMLKGPDSSERLSPKESELLRMLCEFKNDVLPRQKALLEIWKNDDYFTKRSMDVYIAKIRKHLKADESIIIENIHGAGYRLIDMNAA